MQAMLSRWDGKSQLCPPGTPLPVPFLRLNTATLLQKASCALQHSSNVAQGR